MRIALSIALAAVAVLPALAQAQARPPARRQAPIEIRGQVPTPQVVTVRPREVPNYDRRVLVPTFYDHDFWQSILPGYLLVRERTITGTVGDSATVRRDSTPPAITNPPAGTVTPPPTGSPPPPAATQSPAPSAAQDAARRSPPAAVSPALPPR